MSNYLNWTSDELLKEFHVGKIVFYTSTGSQKIAFTAPNETMAWSFIACVVGRYTYNNIASKNAGYPIYYSDDFKSWVSDLGNRLELNLPDASTINIHLNADACIVYHEES